MDQDKWNQDKYSFLEELLEKEFVFVHLNSGASGVIVPEHLTNNPALVLKLSKFFAKPISFDIENGIKQPLLFNGSYFECIIPFEAIWGIISCEQGVGKVWAESAPSPLLAAFLSSSILRSKTPAPKKPSTEQKKPRPSYLKRVK